MAEVAIAEQWVGGKGKVVGHVAWSVTLKYLVRKQCICKS